MGISVAVMFFLAAGLTALAWRQSPQTALAGFSSGGRLFVSILPNLVLGFILAGMIEVLIPKALLVSWVGEGSGARGILVATLLGAATPGGPFVQFPIVASLFKAGAGVGPLMAYLTSWSLLGVSRLLVFELPILGAPLALSRLACSLAVPPLVGVLSAWVYSRVA
jgi:uncharacterized membrane protein YraQ (UPF0718 family)